MLARTSLGLLLLIALVALGLILYGGRESRVVRADRPARDSSEWDERLRELADAPTNAGRTAAADTGAPEISRRAAVPQEVLVRARVASPIAVGAEWLIELQTWDEGLDSVESHRLAADGDGRAEFRFPGPVHVDWVRVVPPDASGLALAFVEEHVDLGPGTIHEVELVPGPGGRIAGRVQDLDGGPAAGARVHAFANGGGESLTDWQPGLIAVESDADGRFRLPRLPAGEWGLAIEPGAWLGYAPETGETIAGLNHFAVGVDSQRENALLVVVRAQPFVLRVIDAAGAPIPGASVRLEPLHLLGGRMRLEPPPEPEPLEVLLGRAVAANDEDAWLWPYGVLSRGTNSRGEVRLFGVAGTWDLSVRGPFDVAERGPPALRERIALPTADRTWTLDARFEVYRGRVVDESDVPLEHTWVTLRLRDTQEFVAVRRTDADGSFVFEWLRPAALYEATARRNGYLTRAWDVAPTPHDAPGEDRRLRAAPGLRLTLVDTAGEPMRSAVWILQAVRPSDLQPGEHVAIEELERSRWLRSGSRGMLQLPGLPAGEIDLGLQRDLPVLDESGQPMIEPNGRARVSQSVVRTWTLRVPPAEQRLEIDVSAWPEPAAAPLALHNGRVVDASTGAPIAGALVILRSPSYHHLARSDREGGFALRGLPGPCELIVHADGYAARHAPPRTWEPIEHEHEFTLSAGAGACELVIEDRDGARLPKVRVTVRDVEQRPLSLVVREPDDVVRVGSEFDAVDGRLCVLAPPPGELDLEVEIADAGSLGRCRVKIPVAATSQVLVTRLERTLAELRAEVLARENEDPR